MKAKSAVCAEAAVFWPPPLIQRSGGSRAFSCAEGGEFFMGEGHTGPVLYGEAPLREQYPRGSQRLRLSALQEWPRGLTLHRRAPVSHGRCVPLWRGLHWTSAHHPGGLCHVRVELPGLEFCKVAYGHKVFPDLEAQVTL
jgi:hypothetical protein